MRDRRAGDYAVASSITCSSSFIAVGQRVGALTKAGGQAERVLSEIGDLVAVPEGLEAAAETVIVNGVTARRTLHRSPADTFSPHPEAVATDAPIYAPRVVTPAVSALGTSLISLSGVIIAAGISAAVAVRQSRQNAVMQADLARLNRQLERETRAEEVLKRYREPLAAAAFDLQSRLYNILRMGFFASFGGEHERCDIAYETTLFRLAQYFGWTEILRRDIQFLSFPEATETRDVVTLQAQIVKRFGTSTDDHGLMIWTDEQRAIGEGMIVEEHDKVLCMGYARFHDEYAARFAPWCERLRPELHAAAGHDRLRDLQHLLCTLVETLDADRTRYTQDLARA